MSIRPVPRKVTSDESCPHEAAKPVFFETTANRSPILTRRGRAEPVAFDWQMFSFAFAGDAAADRSLASLGVGEGDPGEPEVETGG